KKNLSVLNSNKKVKVYEKKSNTEIEGEKNMLITHFAKDSLNTAYVPTNRYNVIKPLITFGYNLDDGLSLGAGFKYFQQGFRKKPYANIQQLNGTNYFSTQAFFIKYKGEWLKAFGKADFTLQATSFVPSNTQNYFGT